MGSSFALVLTGWAAALSPDSRTLSAWAIGALVGNLLSQAYWHPYRVLGFVPLSLAGAFLTILLVLGWGWCQASAGTAGLTLGLALGSLIAYRKRLAVPSTSLKTTVFATAIGVGLLVFPVVAAEYGGRSRDEIRDSYTLGAVVALGPLAAFAWLRLFRPTFELAVEPVLWVMYRVRAAGPGLEEMPVSGPCLVVANHACWLDPLFLAKVLPRTVVPMMTSKFYDVKAIRWLMVRFGVIRVPDRALKQDVPEEIQLAIAALDRGECVVIFPEGFLRRSEEKPLKRFGRGVWQIITARPETPVVTCWIEGGWGSYTSYFNGKPTKNKKPDFRRRIEVGVPAPTTGKTILLETHLQTRFALMNHVAEARKLLGLPDLPPYDLPEKDDGKDEENA